VNTECLSKDLFEQLAEVCKSRMPHDVGDCYVCGVDEVPRRTGADAVLCLTICRFAELDFGPFFIEPPIGKKYFFKLKDWFSIIQEDPLLSRLFPFMLL
jgi:hypothetical protein